MIQLWFRSIPIKIKLRHLGHMKISSTIQSNLIKKIIDFFAIPDCATVAPIHDVGRNGIHIQYAMTVFRKTTF